MKSEIKTVIASILLALSLHSHGENKLYTTSFEKFDDGKLKQRTEGDVTWESKGNVVITRKFQHTGKQSLHLLGGVENALELSLSGAAQNVKVIKFQAERWTSNGHFKFRVLAQVDGQWVEISNLDRETKTGATFRSSVVCEIPSNKKITSLRLLCSAPEGAGVLIDDFKLLKNKPVFYGRSPENYVSSEVCDPVKPALLPIPQKISWGNQAISLGSVAVNFPDKMQDPIRVTQFKAEFKQLLEENKVKVDSAATQQITFKLGEVEVPEHWEGQEKESYTLKSDQKGVVVTANTASGFYYAVQTLRQLMVHKDGKTTVAACDIIDFPAFKIRGFMHDVGRNFQTVEQLKMQIDVMAKFKYNIFHFHCTEYHGWRMESKVYPDLQKPETFTRKPGKYYTQKEFVELVDYCWARNIIIIPEFDTPGHSDAFLKGLGIKRMSDPRALEAITELISEICSLVPVEKMPYFHVGTDEAGKRHQKVGIDYLPALHKAVQDNGREVIGWSKGMTFKGAKQISQTWAKSRPFAGSKHIDSRSNYVNHLESLDFGPRMFFQQPCRVPYGDEVQLGGILCHWPDTKVDNEKLTLTNSPVVPAMVAYSEAVWKGVEKDLSAYWAAIPAKGTTEFRAYADFENRIAQQRDRFFTDTPFVMVKTTNIEWRLFGPVADGEVEDLENKIIKDSYTVNGKTQSWSKPVYGGAIHIKHFFGFQGHIKNLPKGKDVVWANTNIFSPADQEVDAWISFNTISSSDGRTGSALVGDWSKNKKCNVWINGERVDPPVWRNPGVLGKEIALVDQVYTSRKPTKIKLKKGWNSVLMKSAPSWKWVFSFSPVERNGEAYKEVKGLTFSARQNDLK